MKPLTDEAMTRMFYEAAYDFLREHPEFDGRPRPGMPGLMRRGVDPKSVAPWPGVADVRRMGRDQWIAARLAAVAAGDEDPPLRPRGGAD